MNLSSVDSARLVQPAVDPGRELTLAGVAAGLTVG
jgi:hypothetical protein